MPSKVPVLTNPKELRDTRIIMWINQVSANLDSIDIEMDKDISEINFPFLRQYTIRQYELLRIIKNVLEGKIRLEGWKVQS